MRKPLSASDALRQISPRKLLGNSLNTNRFNFLREPSPTPFSPKVRDRSLSVKRKTSDQPSYAEAAASRSATTFSAAFMEDISENLAKVTSLCEKADTALRTQGAEPEILQVLQDICDAVRFTNQVQRDLLPSFSVNSANSSNHGESPFTVIGTIPKKLRTTNGKTFTASQPPPKKVVEPQVSSDPPEVRKFKEAVKDAERSTLVFNLDMGSVPILNMDTISKKATLALTTMAAKAEGKRDTMPSMDAVAAIDDVLSVTKGMNFFGKSTKPYKNPKDKENTGKYYTIPVKYDFKDKDTRIRAETTLRERCKVNCSTPYPTILRECIRQTVNHYKSKYPEQIVRVQVDSSNMCLKVFRRPADKGSQWEQLNNPPKLPDEVLNINARAVPVGFIMPLVPIPSSPPASETMDTGIITPTRLSRKDGQVGGPPPAQK